MANRYVVSKEILKKIVELPKPEINKGLQEKVKTQIEKNTRTKTYLVAYKIYSMLDQSIHIGSYTVTALSKSDAVKKVARLRLGIGDATFETAFKHDDIEILAVTEMLAGDEFKTHFCQQDFKEELVSLKAE